MKTSKGFTLIELLAVISIILIILSISIINFISIDNRKKDEEDKKQKSIAVTSAKQYFESNEYLINDLNDNDFSYVSLKTLVSEDYLNILINPKTNKRYDYCDVVIVFKKNDKYTYKYVYQNDAINKYNISLNNNCVASGYVVRKQKDKEDTTITSKKIVTTKEEEKTTTNKEVSKKSNTTTKKSITTTKITKKTTKEVCKYIITQEKKGDPYSLKIALENKKVNNYYYIVWNKQKTNDKENKKSDKVSSYCKLNSNLIKNASKTGNDSITGNISMIKGADDQYYCFAVKPVNSKICNKWTVQYKHAHLFK